MPSDQDSKQPEQLEWPITMMHAEQAGRQASI